MRHGLPSLGTHDAAPRRAAGRVVPALTRGRGSSIPYGTLAAGLSALLWLILALAGGSLPRPGGAMGGATAATHHVFATTLAGGISPDQQLERAPLRTHVPAARSVPALPRRYALDASAQGTVPAPGLGQDTPAVLPPRCGLALVLATGLRPPPRLDAPPLSPRAPTRAARAPPLGFA